jgi:hypothetical protein
MGHKMQRMMESGADEAAQDTHDQAQQAPFEEGFDEFFRMMQLVQPGHKIASFFVGFRNILAKP